jgi:hypothetical protein
VKYPHFHHFHPPQDDKASVMPAIEIMSTLSLSALHLRMKNEGPDEALLLLPKRNRKVFRRLSAIPTDGCLFQVCTTETAERSSSCDEHERGDGRHFIVRADEKLTAVLELQSQGLANDAGGDVTHAVLLASVRLIGLELRWLARIDSCY